MTDKTEHRKYSLKINPPTLMEVMTLRDYFAAKAMNADLSNSDESLAGYGSQFTDAHLESFAAFYYRIADAMLRARGD